MMCSGRMFPCQSPPFRVGGGGGGGGFIGFISFQVLYPIWWFCTITTSSGFAVNATSDSPGHCDCTILNPDPDPRDNLESRSPNLGPYTTKGTL